MVRPTPDAKSTDHVNVLPIALLTLRAIMKGAPAEYLAPLNFAMFKFGIITARRVAAFLSQLAVESNQLRHTHEQWTSRKDFKLSGVNRAAHSATSAEDYFMYWYGNRSELGNRTAEDGYTYRGRGGIQITGRANYTHIGSAIGKPLETQPDLLETDPSVNMLASAYFFAEMAHLNRVADRVDPNSQASIRQINRRITKGVNGGYNGEAERLSYFKKALRTLCVKPAPVPARSSIPVMPYRYA